MPRCLTTSYAPGAFLCLAILLAANPTLAQAPAEGRGCERQEVPARQRVDACSALIKSGREKGEKLAEVFNNRGTAYRQVGESDHAIADYSQAIKINGRFAAAFNNRGVAYDSKGDFDRAIQDYDQAIKLNASAESYFNRGNAHLAKARYEQAIDDYGAALKLRADFAAALDNRCWARALLGTLKQALADCNEALRLTPHNPASLSSRGFVFFKMSQFDAAVSDYDMALRQDPQLPFPLYGRGLAKLKNQDASGAADIAAAKLVQSDIADEFRRYGANESY